MIFGKGKTTFLYIDFFIIILSFFSRDSNNVHNSLYDRISSSFETETGKQNIKCQTSVIHQYRLIINHK